MEVIEKIGEDICKEEVQAFVKCGYVCVDTETTGLEYLTDRLCTIQLYCEKCSVLLEYRENGKYNNLVNLFISKDVVKIFHNAVFDVSFLMKNLKMESFGTLVCTKISAKLIFGLEHNNSLKALLKEYFEIEIDKRQQMSDWSKEQLSIPQKEYAMNDVKYLYSLWNRMCMELKKQNLLEIAYKCFEFVPKYKVLTDRGIENIFIY